MRQARISELKNHLSSYLALVRGGETIQVLDRNEPIAQIVPMPERALPSDPDVEARLCELERRGIVRRGHGGIPRCIAEGPPQGPSVGVLEALLEERRRGP